MSQLAIFSYYEHVNMLGIWYHKTQPISLSLIADDFDVKYVSKEGTDHLIACIKSTYTLTKDWTSDLYVVSPLIGIIPIKQSTFPCLDTSRKSSKNTITLRQKQCKWLLIHRPQTIWFRGPTLSCSRYISLFDKKRNQASPTNCWKHFLLCPCSGYASPHSP